MPFLLRHPSFAKSSLNLFRIRNHCTITPNPNPKSSLSSRLSFVFDQIDAADDQPSAKFEAVQKIRQWRENRISKEKNSGNLRDPGAKLENSKDPDGTIGIPEGPNENIFTNTESAELVHPWPEWIEFMDRLGQQNYFDFRKSSEDSVAKSIGIDLSEVKEDVGLDFSRDWITVKNGCMNFGRARFDILRSLAKNDIQILVGHGCPSMDPKVVLSAKRLRKYVHLNEGDVCSSCSLRNTCIKGYLLISKEDEARTIDIMHILLTYAFDHVNGSVTNKPLMQMKPIKTAVRKLLNEIVKLSAVPIDPNLPPPVMKRPPPKVKQPPPQPRKRVGRDDVEMKKGDWLCPKCDFMNYAKNTVCLQCDENRPKRQLLPGEWECPQCNFLNYRRNMACLHCDTERPPEEFTNEQIQKKQSQTIRAQVISNSWNVDFDDNESDGADVAAFEFADSCRGKHNTYGFDDTLTESVRTPEGPEYISDDNGRKGTMTYGRTGFDDFDDEEVDYNDDDDVDVDILDGSNNNASDLEESESFDHSNRNRVRGGSKGFSDKKVMNFYESDDFGGKTRREFRSNSRDGNGGERENLDKFNHRNRERYESNQFDDLPSKRETEEYDDKFGNRYRRRRRSNQFTENGGRII